MTSETATEKIAHSRLLLPVLMLSVFSVWLITVTFQLLLIDIAKTFQIQVGTASMVAAVGSISGVAFGLSAYQSGKHPRAKSNWHLAQLKSPQHPAATAKSEGKMRSLQIPRKLRWMQRQSIRMHGRLLGNGPSLPERLDDWGEGVSCRR